MTTAKVIEIICEGTSVEAALQAGVKDAIKTLKQVRQIDVKHIQGLVEKEKVAKFRVTAHLTFVLSDEERG